MKYAYRIALPRDVWDDFTHRIANVDASAPRGVDTFLAAAKNLNIRREGTDVIVESSDINEDEIIAALLAGKQQEKIKQTSYQLHVNCPIDTNSLQINICANASEDGYPSRLKMSLKDTLEYHSTDLQYCLKSA